MKLKMFSRLTPCPESREDAVVAYRWGSTGTSQDRGPSSPCNRGSVLS